ncbi:MAG: energy-coupling factor transporter transmembrane protein EcfT [Dethiobacteria bacterium]
MGQYFPGSSLLHRLNARFKLLLLLLFLVLLFLVETFAGLGLLLGLLLLLAALTRIPFSYLLRGLKPIFYIVVLTLIVYFFFSRGGVVLLRLGPVTVESQGVVQGLFIVGRLVIIVLATMLVTLTTTPLNLTYGLESFLKPLRLVKVPVAEIAVIMTIALRFIPTLMEESQRIMKAQEARGADFESGSLWRRARAMTPLIVPLFVSAFRRADELALAMEARGYRVGAERTRMHQDPVTARDWLALLFLALLFAGIVIAGI